MNLLLINNNYKMFNNGANNNKNRPAVSFKDKNLTGIQDLFSKTPRDIQGNISISHGLFKNIFSGEINDMKFHLEQENFADSLLNITGTINDKNVNLSGDYENWTRNKIRINGDIGDKNLDLTLKNSLFGDSIKGKYGNEEIKYKLKYGYNSAIINGEGTDLELKCTDFFCEECVPHGTFGQNSEIIPILAVLVDAND